MYSDAQYSGWTENMITRTFFFTAPYPTTKVRLDDMKQLENIVFRVEFLGLDTKSRNSMVDPMSGGYIDSSKSKLI